MKKFLGNLLFCDWAATADPDVKRRILVHNSIILVGIPIAAIFAVYNCFADRLLIAGADVVLFFVLLLSSLILRKRKSCELAGFFVLSAFFLFLAFISTQEKVDNSGVMLWFFMFPVTVIFLLF